MTAHPSVAPHASVYSDDELRFLEEAVAEVVTSARDRLNHRTVNHVARLVFEAYRDGVRDRGMLIKIGEIAIDPTT